MQYAFAYFYYLMNSASARDLQWPKLWSDEIDVDGSGCGERHHEFEN